MNLDNMIPLNLTVSYTVYNESNRIAEAVAYSARWASKVLVFDKQSDDDTASLAIRNGASVYKIPFTEAGDDDFGMIMSKSTTDWLIWLTPGERLSPGLINLISELLPNVDDNVDVIALPVKLFSFGRHVRRNVGPWSISYQPRLLNVKRARPVRQIHQHVAFTAASKFIPFGEEAYILHCTHRGFLSFVRSHAEYAVVEGRHAENREDRLEKALIDAAKYDPIWEAEGESSLQYKLAWKIYNYMIALNILVPSPVEIEKSYSKMLEDLTRKLS